MRNFLLIGLLHLLVGDCKFDSYLVENGCSGPKLSLGLGKLGGANLKMGLIPILAPLAPS